MKKILPLFLIAFLCWPPTAAAEGLVHRPGEWNIGVGLKTSTPGLGTDWGEFNVDNETLDMSHDAKPGTTSLGFDLQSVYFLTDWLAAGLSLGSEYFDHDIASGWEMDVDTTVLNFLFLARVFLNPSQKYKVYIPLAAGLNHIMSTIDMYPEEHFHYTGFAGHVGLGVERLLNEKWGVALEARYNYNKFHKSKTNAVGHHMVVYPELNYISLSLRADYRF